MSSKDQKLSNEQVLDENVEKQLADVKAETAVEAAFEAENEQVIRLEGELADAMLREKETLLRAKAEVENMRRRTEQDIEKAHKFALERFTIELLPVIDNLERAIDLADKDNQDLAAMLEGVQLTLKSMLDAVHKFGVEVIEETNVPFNPELHQAMTMLESNEYQPNHIMMVMQKGYTLNGRLIRPAMVAVSK